MNKQLTKTYSALYYIIYEKRHVQYLQQTILFLKELKTEHALWDNNNIRTSNHRFSKRYSTSLPTNLRVDIHFYIFAGRRLLHPLELKCTHHHGDSSCLISSHRCQWQRHKLTPSCFRSPIKHFLGRPCSI